MTLFFKIRKELQRIGPIDVTTQRRNFSLAARCARSALYSMRMLLSRTTLPQRIRGHRPAALVRYMHQLDPGRLLCADLAMKAIPIEPEAPDLFSTTICLTCG